MQKASIIVTGATGSMGRAAVRALAAKGESVIAVCRSKERGEKMLAELTAEFPSASIELALADLSSIASVEALAGSLEGRDIKGLFNNAGTLLRDYTLSKDGLEMCVAVNFVAPFILCDRIGAKMAPGSHIVNMVSLTCRYAAVDDSIFKDGPELYSQLGTYAKSKLALMLASMEYARRHPELHVNVSDPGIVNSNMISMDRWFDPLADIFFRPFISSPAKGVAPALRALGTDVTGKLFVGKKIKDIPDRCLKGSDVNRLWAETERIIKSKTEII